jgi:deoxyribodipyrimidine photo-lyase
LGFNIYFSTGKEVYNKNYNQKSCGARCACATAFLISTESNMNNQNILVWFRNDLRSHDCETLYRASEEANRTGANIFSVYCFDLAHFDETSFGFEKTGAFRAKFLIESVTNLRESLRSLNSDLMIRLGNPDQILPELTQQLEIGSIYYHAEVTTEEKTLEKKLRSIFKEQKVNFQSFWGNTLIHRDD